MVLAFFFSHVLYFFFPLCVFREEGRSNGINIKKYPRVSSLHIIASQPTRMRGIGET